MSTEVRDSVGCGDPHTVQEAWKVGWELVGEACGGQTWED